MSSAIETTSTDPIKSNKKEALWLQFITLGKRVKNSKEIDGLYAKFVLVVLVFVYILNFIDRQILAVLAEDIKADLGVSDAELGFLYGTAFAVFYAVFGIPLGRLADVWNRKNLISLGICFWSVMTAVSGTAKNFASLALFRFGVGVGEASASPAAYSILYDYFSPKVRTTVLAIYASGLYIGLGLGIFLGGLILDTWNNTYPDPSLAPMGLKGWQVAFFAVGFPGLLVALLVSTLCEPVRGQGDGVVGEPHPHPFRETGMVLMSMLPITNLWVLREQGCSMRVIGINLMAGALIALVAYGLIQLTGSLAQWAALGVGVYAVVSWMQVLAVRDPVVFGMIFSCKALLYTNIGGAISVFMWAAIGFWSIPFLQRYHNVSAAEVGAVVGFANAAMGFTGVILGGILADKLRARTPRGKLYVVLGGMVFGSISAFLLFFTDDLTVAYAACFSMSLTSSIATGPAMSIPNDLVLPRGRATTSAFCFMSATFIGSALGPYIIGHVSDVIAATGVSGGEALRQALLWSLVAPVIGVVLVVQALRYIEHEEAGLLDRARALGERV